MEERDVVLEVQDVTKRFPGVIANQDVNLKLHRGEILALLGENGAGKSTLMNIIYGLYHQDEGQVFLKGQEVRFASPREAIHSGIGMVHQHFQLVEVMNVAENVVLGEEKDPPNWRSAFSVLFSLILGIFTISLIVNNGNPLVYSTFTMAGLAVALPMLITRLLARRLGLESIRFWLTFVFQVAVLVGLTYSAVVKDTPAEDIALTLVGASIFATLGYAIPYILQDNPLQETIHQRFGQALAVPINLAVTLTGLALSQMVLVAVLWLLPNTEGNVQTTIEFLARLLLGVIVAAVVAVALAWLLTWIFGYWKQTVAILRTLWGFAWRVGLILIALWIGGQSRTISRMGIIAGILQHDVPYTIDNGDVGATGTREIEINWRRIEREGDSDQQLQAILAEIDGAFYRDETFEAGNGLAVHVKGYWGVSQGWRNAVDNVPPVVRDVVVAGLLILFAVYGLQTWRGEQLFPGKLSIISLGLMAALGFIFVGGIWETSEHIDDGPRALLTALGLVAVVATYLRVVNTRQRDPNRIRPITPPDTVIDALTDLFYTVFSVRDTHAAAERVRDLSRQYGLEVDPHAIIEKLPVGLQQRVEIIKALYRKADILILDEPTAVLTPQEGQELFKIMRELAAQGVSIIFITHKLKEVFEVATNIVVMRGGKVVGTTTPAEATRESLAAMMVGRSVLLVVDKTEAKPEGKVLDVENLTAYDDRGALALNGVSLEVHAGEVLGVAGVQGNGQSELVEVLTGLRPMEAGAVELLGQELKPKRHPDATFAPRFWAVVIDAVLVAFFTAIVSYFTSYFGGDGQLAKLWSGFENPLTDFKMLSAQTLLVFVLLDAVYTLFAWQLGGATFGKLAMGLRIVDRNTDGQPNFAVLLQRYLSQTVTRIVAPILYPVLKLTTVNTEALHWYDRLPTINCRVEHLALISPRLIKDLRSSHVPEDRLRFGLVKPYTVQENLILNDYYEAPHAKAPSRTQLPMLGAAYVALSGAIFAIFGYFWLYWWNTSLWDSLLSSYGVPDTPEARTVPIGVGMSSLQRNYLNDPMLLSLIILVLMTVLLAGVAYVLARLIVRFLAAPLSFFPALGVIAGSFALYNLLDALLEDNLNSLALSPISALIAAVDVSFTPEINHTLLAGLALVVLMIGGVIYQWLTAEHDPLNDLGKRGFILDSEASLEYSKRLIEQYDIRTPSALTTGGALSGGNQQKLVVAREFSREPRLLIASQPTRGIDVGSIEFIHQRIIKQRDQGAAVLLVSAELDEIMSLSDRIAVMYKGQIIKVVKAGEATREELGLLMAGITH